MNQSLPPQQSPRRLNNPSRVRLMFQLLLLILLAINFSTINSGANLSPAFFFSAHSGQASLLTTQAPSLEVSVRVSKKRLATTETLMLTVFLKGVGVDRIKIPPLFPGSFEVIAQDDRPSLSQDATGRPVTGRTLRYQLQPQYGGKFRLGNFTIQYFGETYQTAGETVEVDGPLPPSSGDATESVKSNRRSTASAASANPAISAESAPPNPNAAARSNGPLSLRLTPELSATTAYVGQTVIFSVRLTHNATLVKDIKPMASPAMINFWSTEVVLTPTENPYREVTIRGQVFGSQLIHRYALAATTAGELTIPALQYTATAIVNQRPQTVTLQTPPTKLVVRPLPTLGRPANFSGIVGQCSLQAMVDPLLATLGTPQQLKLQITLSGNPDIIIPPPINNLTRFTVFPWRRLQPNNIANPRNNLSATNMVQWETTIVANQAGAQTFPALTLHYFDPVKQQYQTQQTAPITLQIQPVPAGLSASAPNSINPQPTSRTFPTYQVLIYLAALGFLLLLLTFSWRYWRLKPSELLRTTRFNQENWKTLFQQRWQWITKLKASFKNLSKFNKLANLNYFNKLKTNNTLNNKINDKVETAHPTPHKPPLIRRLLKYIVTIPNYFTNNKASTAKLNGAALSTAEAEVSTEANLPLALTTPKSNPVDSVSLAGNLAVSPPNARTANKPLAADSLLNKSLLDNNSSNESAPPLASSVTAAAASTTPPLPLTTALPSATPSVPTTPSAPATPPPPITNTANQRLTPTRFAGSRPSTTTAVPTNPPALAQDKKDTLAPAQLAAETSRLLNRAYGKLHRGDERAYATLILEALRQLLTLGFQAPTNLNIDNLEAFLVQQLISPSLVTNTVQLYRECSTLSFHPTTTYQPNSEQDYARFLAARRIFDQLLTQLPTTVRAKKN